MTIGRFRPKIELSKAASSFAVPSGSAESASLTVRVDASRGKGSHQTLYFGSAFTVIRNPKDDLKTGTFHAMCSQLGINASDL